MIRRIAARAHQGEDGHALPLLGAFVAAAGMVMLGIGAAQDSDVLTIAGGIVGGVGIVAGRILGHVTFDWEMYRRTEGK